jgi:hypothetical protein
MARDEVDDTDMTPDDFRRAAAQGVPVRVVTSRDVYEAAVGLLRPLTAVYVANIHLSLADAGPQPAQNLPARLAS